MPRAEFGVIPHRAGVKANEILGGEIEQTQLAIERKRGLYIRHDDALVIISSDLAVRTKAQGTRR